MAIRSRTDSRHSAFACSFAARSIAELIEGELLLDGNLGQSVATICPAREERRMRQMM